MELGIKNKFALVTGCSKNIGKSIAISLAKEGVNLILVARTKKELEKLKKTLNKYTNKIFIIPLDLMNENNIKKLFNFFKEKSLNIEIIVHNLGGSLNIKNSSAKKEDWIKVWNYNLGIAIEINNYFLPKMKKLKWGRIVHISTLATSTNDGYIPYIVSKNAVEGYVRALSKETSKYNININCVSPGLVNLKDRFFSNLKKNNLNEYKKYLKNNIPINRMAEPHEISNVVTFLCSIHSSYMSGSIVKIDGVGN